MEKIKAEGLKKKFKLKDGQKVNKNGSITNEVEVLNGVDLSIIKGEFLTVVGPSGCGKSVLLDIIGGLTNLRAEMSTWITNR